MDGWMDNQMNKYVVDEWMDEHMNKQMNILKFSKTCLLDKWSQPVHYILWC